jgi:hypothetical protein
VRAAPGTNGSAPTGHENDAGKAFFDDCLIEHGCDVALLRAVRDSMGWQTFRKMRRHATTIDDWLPVVGRDLLHAKSENKAGGILTACIAHARTGEGDPKRPSKWVLRRMNPHERFMIRLAFNVEQGLATLAKAIDSLSCCV